MILQMTFSKAGLLRGTLKLGHEMQGKLPYQTLCSLSHPAGNWRPPAPLIIVPKIVGFAKSLQFPTK